MAAEKKRGGNSSPAISMKLSAALSGVALGVVSCLAWYDPVPVHADAGNFAGAVDYILSASGASAGFILTPGGAFVTGALIGIYMCTQSPLPAGVTDLNAENISFASGYYTFNGSLRTGYIASYSDSSGTVSYTDSRIPLVYTTDYRITIVNGSGINYGRTQFGVDANGAGFTVVLSPYASSPPNSTIVLDTSQSIWEPGTYGGTSWQGGYRYSVSIMNVSGWSVPELGSTNTQYLLDGVKGSGSNTYLLKQTPFDDSLPTGTIDLSNPQGYIDNILRPYVEINYPDYIYLLPEPEPEPPQYATDDIVPGIPKDWTIINPELPTSPHLDLTIPEGDFQAIDPGDTFTGFASGVGFWWSMVNEILTTFHIKTLALALLAVAVAIFALYKIGG